MTKQGGSLPRGRRRHDEVPGIPAADGLNHVERVAQRGLRELVEEAGGRFDTPTTKRIGVGHIGDLADLFEAWGRDNAGSRGERCYFAGRPGFWHALDRLYPLQDPNRWDALRVEVIVELEARGWRRASPPRGIGFYLPE